jgi:hypothetical protein
VEETGFWRTRSSIGKRGRAAAVALPR